MNTEKITSEELYTVEASKENGDTLNAEEWNKLSDAAKVSHEKINGIIDDLSTVATNISEDMSELVEAINVRANGDIFVNGTKNIILKAGSETNSVGIRTGADTTAAFAKSNSTIRSDKYTLNRNGELVAIDTNGSNLGPHGITVIDVINATDLVKNEGGETVIDLFSNNDTKIVNRTIRTGGRYEMIYLTPSQAESYDTIPADFLTNPNYSDFVFTGIDQFVINNVANGYTNDLSSLATGLTIPAIPNEGDDNIIFAITSASSGVVTTGGANDTNTRIVVLNKIDVKEATVGDIVTLVDYFKSNNQGPWAN